MPSATARRRRQPGLTALALAAALACASGHAYADGVAPNTATPVQREQAQTRFARGRELFSQSQFAAALEAFRGSMEIVSSPNARLYIARCLREMGNLGVAYNEFVRAVAEARDAAREDPKYQKTAEAAEEERKALAAKVGFVSVVVAHGADNTVMRVAGEEIPRARWNEPIAVAAGRAEVSVETPSKPPQTLAVDVTAGQTRTLNFDAEGTTPVAQPPPPPPPPPPPAEDDDSGRKSARTAAFVAAGVGVVGLATFAIFGAMSNSKYNDLKSACNGGPCPASRQGDIDTGKRDQRIANVALVFGVLGAGAAVTLFILSQPKKSQAPAAALVVGPLELGLRGAF
jgi:hypothetical protein